MLAVALSQGCGRPSPDALPWTPAPAPDLGPPVARVGDVAIFAEEVRAQAVKTGKTPSAAVQDLIAFHLLAERARPSWFSAPNEAILKQVLVQRLLERDLESRTGADDMPDMEVQRLYDRARTHFVHPRLVEVAVLTIPYGRKATAGDKALARAAATELAAYVAKRPVRTAEDFEAIAAEEIWRKKQVSHSRFLQGPDSPYPAKFGVEVARLKAPGQTTGVIEDETRLHIARYAGEKPPSNTTFEQVRAELRAGHYPRWRQARFIELADGLAAKHTVEQNPAALAGSRVPGS